MPSLFPGMNPYLESPGRWQEFHSRLIVAIADEIGPRVRPRYRAAVEIRVYEEIRERYLEIREVASGEVVTTLELLSPSNKRAGKGRSLYEEKRLRILGSRTHLIEVDLIRSFRPLPIRGTVQPSLFRILITRSHQRPRAALYPFGLSDPIPPLPVPLKPDEPEPIVDLQSLLHQVYDRAGYDLEIDYTHDPVPPLKNEDATWVDALLKQQSLR